jgi:hypothetical protein
MSLPDETVPKFGSAASSVGLNAEAEISGAMAEIAQEWSDALVHVHIIAFDLSLGLLSFLGRYSRRS